MPSNVPYVFLDIGSTLMDGPKLSPVKELMYRFGLPDEVKDDLTKLIFCSDLTVDSLTEHMYELVGMPDPRIQKTSGYRRAIQQMWDRQTRGGMVVHGAMEFLDSLEEKDIPFGFISNIWAPYRECFEYLYSDYLHKSRITVMSYEVGVAKPDMFIYEIAKEQAVGHDRLIMIGDTYDNDIVPAMNSGMRTVWLLRRLENEAESLLRVLNNKVPRPTKTVRSFDELNISDLL